MLRALLAAILLSLAGRAGASQPSQPVAWSSFGMDYISNVPTNPLNLCRIWDQAGAEWANVETASGVYSWTALDALVSSMSAQGCVISYTFGNVPGWANGNAGRYVPPTSFSDFYTFATAVSTRYAGKIRYYTAWNEPNSGVGDWWSGTVAQMVTLTEGVATTIHGVDPIAKVLAPSTTDSINLDGVTYMDALFKGGIGAFVDGIDCHAYRYYLTPASSTPPEQIWLLLERYQGLRAAYGMLGKPWLVTEGGWGQTSVTNPTTAQQQEWAVTWPFFNAAHGVTGFAWYEYDNLVGWGVLFSSGSLTTAGTAYTAAANMLNGASFSAVPARVPATNQVRNPGASGAVPGTPGTAPTNWAVLNGDTTFGVSTQIVGSGVESGIPYVDFRIFGTPTAGAGGSADLTFEAAGQIAATNGQQWTSAAYIKLQAGSASNVQLSLNFDDLSSGSYLSTPLFVPFTPLGYPLQYDLQSWPTPTQDASVAFVRPYIQFAYTVGSAFDITVRVGSPSMDTGSIWSGIFTKAGAYQGQIVWEAAGGPTSWAAPAWCNWVTNAAGTKTAVFGPLSLGVAPEICTNQ